MNNQEEMDTTDFKPIKKTHGGLIFLLFILSLIGLGSFYYFIYDSSIKLFGEKIVNTTFILKNKFTQNIQNTNFTISTNISTKEKSKLITSINNISINGYVSYNSTNSNLDLNITPTYKNNDLFAINSLVSLNNTGITYVSLDNIYEKTIKINNKDFLSSKSTDKVILDNNATFNDYQTIYLSLSDALTSALETAEYTKKYLKKDNEYQKKASIIIDKKFKETMYTKLINDSKFVLSYSKLINKTEEEANTKLNKEMSELTNEKIIIDMYLDIITNKFKSLEIKDNNNKIIINKKENKYNYELINNSIKTYTGFFEYKETSSENNITLNMKDLEKESSYTIYLDLSHKDNFVKLDKDNIIEYNEIEETTKKEIIEKMISNIESVLQKNT